MPIGQAGETLEVAVPDHGLDRRRPAALDGAAQHPLGRVRPEIGGQQRPGGAGLESAGEHHGRERRQTLQQLDIGVGEAARAVADPGGEEVGGVAQRQGRAQRRAQRQIVGGAFRREPSQHRELAHALAALEPAAQQPRVLGLEPVERAGAPRLLAPGRRPRRVVDRGRPAVAPDRQRGVEFRVQQPGPDRGAGDRRPGLAQRDAERLQQAGQIPAGQGRGRQRRCDAPAAVGAARLHRLIPAFRRLTGPARAPTRVDRTLPLLAAAGGGWAPTARRRWAPVPHRGLPPSRARRRSRNI